MCRLDDTVRGIELALWVLNNTVLDGSAVYNVGCLLTESEVLTEFRNRTGNDVMCRDESIKKHKRINYIAPRDRSRHFQCRITTTIDGIRNGLRVAFVGVLRCVLCLGQRFSNVHHINVHGRIKPLRPIYFECIPASRYNRWVKTGWVGTVMIVCCAVGYGFCTDIGGRWLGRERTTTPILFEKISRGARKWRKVRAHRSEVLTEFQKAICSCTTQCCCISIRWMGNDPNPRAELLLSK